MESNRLGPWVRKANARNYMVFQKKVYESIQRESVLEILKYFSGGFIKPHNFFHNVESFNFLRERLHHILEFLTHFPSRSIHNFFGPVFNLFLAVAARILKTLCIELVNQSLLHLHNPQNKFGDISSWFSVIAI